MFKVECPGCKAPYQVDERRVPSSGLKMRCPKCGTSFQVDPPPDPRTTGPAPVIGPPIPRKTQDPATPGLPPIRRDVARKNTVLGVAGPSDQRPPAQPAKATLQGTGLPPTAKPTIPGAPGVRPPAVRAPGLSAEPRVKPPVPTRPLGQKPAVPTRPGAATAPLPLSLDDLDLPAIGGAKPSRLDADLPSPVVRDKPVDDFADFGDIGIDLGDSAPPSSGGIDLPSPVQPKSASLEADFGEVDLPIPQQPRGRTMNKPLADELDLPVVGGGLSKATDADFGGGGFGEVDLPLPAASFGDLPAPRSGASGRSTAAGFGPSGPGGFGELDLPSLGGDLPSVGGDLPSPVRAGLPSPAAGLPAIAAGLPSPAAALPSPAASLPSPAAGLPMNAAGLPSQAATLPIPGQQATQPQAPAPPPEMYGELDFGEAPRPAAAPALTRQAGSGGTDFGEVNLEGGDAGSIDALDAPSKRPAPAEDDMEFGAIPQEGAPAAPAPIGPAVETRVPGVIVRKPLPPFEPPKPRRSRRVLFAVIVVLMLAGGALALVPAIGPFGATFIYDKVKSGDHQKLLADTAKNARERLALDTFPESTQAYQQAERARSSATRLRGLAALVVFVAYERELRFGADPEVNARAQVLLGELKDEKPANVPHLEMARIAHDAATGQLPRARQAADALAKSRATDPDVLVLRGEIELFAKDPKTSLDAWQKAAAVEKSARTSYGLARAHYLNDDRKKAEELAREALKQNSAHAGARILVARSNWKDGKEADAVKLLDEVKSGGKASPGELVQAHTLFGDVHLGRSRVTHAEAAYGEALKIDPKAARALVGLGEALFRAGRFSEALARFEAASQADADEINARIGVAKSQLALERLQDATASIKKLRDAKPKSMLVAYWHGRVLEAVGNRKDAETAYRDAIKLGEKDPESAQVYVALAMLLNTRGATEEATKVLSDARANLPDIASIHIALGELALSQARYDEAVSELMTAMKIDPGDLGAKFKLGIAYRRAKRFEDATKTFDEVAAIDKDYPGLALERGLLFEAAGKTDEALKSYEAALARAPEDPDLMLRVGCSKAAAGLGKEAEDLVRKVLNKRPTSAEANHCLGRALLAKGGGEVSEALRVLEKAAEHDANRAEYHLYVGWAANEAGRGAKAESALKKALELDQGLADAYWQRGVLRYKGGALRDAVRDLKKALELKPDRIEAHAALADCYYDLGQEPAALAEYQIAVQGKPDIPTWRFRYGKLLAANHRDGEAVEQLKKALELAGKQDPKPKWEWEANHVLARSLGKSKDSIPHWEAFLRLGPTDSPYRGEAKKILTELGKPWEGP